MKIISKYKDYYDSALSYGIDTSQVYVRHEQLIEKERPNKDYYFSSSYGLKVVSPTAKYISVNIYSIGFCGEMYPACQFKIFESYQAYYAQSSPLESKIFYHIDKIKDHIFKLFKNHKFDQRYGRVYTEKVLIQRIDHQMKHIKALEQSKIVTAWFYELDTPVFVLPAKSYLGKRFSQFSNRKYLPSNKIQILINPILKNAEFYRIMNPVDCYQRINQYRFGVLGAQKNNPSKQSDIEKVKSHGFDLKYGFRTRPKK